MLRVFGKIRSLGCVSRGRDPHLRPLLLSSCPGIFGKSLEISPPALFRKRMAQESHFEILQMLTAIPVPAFVFDMETRRFLAANTAFEKLLCYSDAELQTMTVSEIRPAEDAVLLQRAIEQEPPEGAVEWRYLCKSGTPLHVHIKYRNSDFLIGGHMHHTRLVVVTSWDWKPVKTAREVFE